MKKLLPIILLLLLSVSLAVPALADGVNAGGGEPTIHYAHGQPTTWNSPNVISMEGIPWLIGYQDGDFVDCNFVGFDESPKGAYYTFRDGCTIQVAPNPNSGITLVNFELFDVDGKYNDGGDFSFFNNDDWSDTTPMEPITLHFDKGLVTLEGTRVTRNEYVFTSLLSFGEDGGFNGYFQIDVASAKAYPSTQTVEVDGKKVEFQCYALKDANGNDTNYIKLRDLADILSGTAAQFDVGWDGSVIITTGKPYAKNGTEQQTPFSGVRDYQGAGDADVIIDGESVGMAAFVLHDDNGGGYTYFKLRDLGDMLGFTVDWNAQRGIYIETTPAL